LPLLSTRRDVVTKVTASVAYTDSLAGAYDDPETPSAPWVAAPRIVCPRLTLRAEGLDEAELFERFGELGYQEHGGEALTTDPWIDLEGKYVRVTVPLDLEDGGGAPDEEGDPPKPLVWYGYVPQGARQRVPITEVVEVPDEEPEAVTRLVGVQQWRAVSLAWFLGRRQVDSAVVADRSPGAANGATRRVLRPMTFNGGDDSGTVEQSRPRGNKSLLLDVFVAAESRLDKPRVLVQAAGNTPATSSTIALVAETGTPTVAKQFARLNPPGMVSPPAAPSTTLTQEAQRLATLAGDFLALVHDTVWKLDRAASIEWSAESMFKYLLTHHAPLDAIGVAAPCLYKLHAGGDVLRALRPTVATEGRDVLSLLTTIAGRSRGVTWSATTVTPDEDPALEAPEVRLAAHSLAGAPITLPGGGVFPANPTLWDLDSDDDPFGSVTTVTQNREARYDRVRVRGARMTSTFTVGVDDATLAKEWSDAEQALYLAGASAASGYPTELDDQRRANDTRRAELDLERVFSAFRVPAAWDGRAGDGAAATTREDVFPTLSRTGAVTGAFEVYLPTLELLQRTRLPQAPTQGDEFEPAFAVFQDAQEKWGLAHALTDYASEADDRLASYRLSRGENGLSFRLASSKGLAHTLAGAAWTGAAPSRLESEVDYQSLRVTLSVEADHFAEATAGEDPTAGTPVEELVIDAGETYRLDWLAKNTIVGVEGGVLKKAPAGRRLRDDRPALEKIAAMAFAWYRQTTQAVRLTLQRPYHRVRVGDFLNSIGRAARPDAIGTVVVEVSLGIGDEQSTTIVTAGVEGGGLGAVVTEGRSG
jgi:hypothetical protein